MVYNEKLVAVVKCKGKVLKEFAGNVYVPFGSEYSITLNNLNTKRAVVNVTIDGEDVLDGQQLIVNANSKINLEGFLKGKKVTNKFKFIEKTAKIEAFRGNKVQDGIIRISYKFAADPVFQPRVTDTYISTYGYDPFRTQDYMYCDTRTSDARSYTKSMKCSSYVNEDGITGKGSASSQEFGVGYVDALEVKEHVIVFMLKGKTKNSPVKEAVTAKTKIECPLCGTKNSTKSKYCRECGNALIPFA